MDLKVYFHKVHTIEATIPGEHAIVVSLETPDGGKPGHLNEVTRPVAAILVAQGKARLATEEEAEEFAASVRAAAKSANEGSLESHVHLSLLPQADLELLRSVLRSEA